MTDRVSEVEPGRHRPIVLADVGGTNARFAVSSATGRFDRVRGYRAAEYPSFPDALRTYLADCFTDVGADGFAGARIAGAGPVNGRVIVLTNSPWRVSMDDVAGVLGVETGVALFNDLEAVGMALPYLGPGDCQVLGAAVPSPVAVPSPGRRAMLAVNVGTGFGASCAVPLTDGEWTATSTEAGHISFAARTSDEQRLLQTFDVVEDVLSGAGLVSLIHAVSSTPEAASDFDTPQALFASDAGWAIDIFTDVLARTAGDLVLAHGAWGGLYLCGSVAKTWADRCSHQRLSRFRGVFNDKGKMSEHMKAVPVFVITAEHPALIGLSIDRSSHGSHA
ncbi:MAG: glucokinase [Pseudomonadota bacterium]